MKILRDGDLERLKKWYMKSPWICGHCGCEFLIEDEKEVRHYTGDQTEPADDWSCTCPYCNRGVALSQKNSNHPPRRFSQG